MRKNKYVYPEAHVNYLKEDFRYWLVLNMERTDISPMELAKRIGAGGIEIYQILQGSRTPLFPSIIRICDALGVTIEEFFCDKMSLHTNADAIQQASFELNRLYLQQGYICDTDINKIFGLPDPLNDEWRYE